MFILACIDRQLELEVGESHMPTLKQVYKHDWCSLQ